MPPSDRADEVREALRPITDPELDESVVELGFISDIAVEERRVAVSFRLPTFWCSANFAFIMAEDMRDALARLAWIERSEIRLVDHFAADRINAGIAAGRGFSEVFEVEADLGAVRQTFRRKAYLGRMSALIEILRNEGRAAADILAMRIGDLQAIADGPVALASARFLERRAGFGGASTPDAFAFHKPEGENIEPRELRDYLRDIRMVRRSAEANGEMCRMLLRARLESPPAEGTSAGPLAAEARAER
jgi:metal-sulfur cluster biosynthetic enzyme